MADGARGGLRECPVFHPTIEEFSNFEQYVMSIESQCVEHGICKIVPPPGWKPRVLPARRADKDDMQLNGRLKGPPGSPSSLVDPRPLLAGSPHFGAFADPGTLL